jgi:hypothetical protein
MLAAQAGEAMNVIEGTAEPVALPAPKAQLEPTPPADRAATGRGFADNLLNHLAAPSCRRHALRRTDRGRAEWHSRRGDDRDHARTAEGPRPRLAKLYRERAIARARAAERHYTAADLTAAPQKFFVARFLGY